MSLFELGSFKLNSGSTSPFKIECDALTDQDWECLAWLLATRVRPFGQVEGVPEGGIRLAEKMRSYQTIGPLLVVDDVYTTGGSMTRFRSGRAARSGREVLGAVAFARSKPPEWITPLFLLADEFRVR